MFMSKRSVTTFLASCLRCLSHEEVSTSRPVVVHVVTTTLMRRQRPPVSLARLSAFVDTWGVGRSMEALGYTRSSMDDVIWYDETIYLCEQSGSPRF